MKTKCNNNNNNIDMKLFLFFSVAILAIIAAVFQSPPLNFNLYANIYKQHRLSHSISTWFIRLYLIWLRFFWYVPEGWALNTVFQQYSLFKSIIMSWNLPVFRSDYTNNIDFHFESVRNYSNSNKLSLLSHNSINRTTTDKYRQQEAKNYCPLSMIRPYFFFSFQLW